MRGAFVAALTVVACRESVTASQIVVVISTDIDVPGGIDGFTARVQEGDGGAVVSNRSFLIGAGAGSVVLPASFGVAPRQGDASRIVTIEVDATLGGATLFSTRALTSFLQDRTLRLDMFLASRCIDEAETCREDETCRREGCVPAEIEPGDLPGFDEDAVERAKSFGDEGTEYPFGMGLDAAGNVYLAGHFAGSVPFGADGELLTAAAEPDVFVASIAPDGSNRWGVGYDVGGGDGVAIAVDPSGHSYTTGNFTRSFDVGDISLVNEDGSTQQIFLAGLHEDGGPNFAARSTGTAGQGRSATAIGASGESVVLGGHFDSDLDFGARHVETLGDWEESFLARFDPKGAPDWSCPLHRSTGGGGDARITAIHFSGDQLAVAGYYAGRMNFGVDAYDQLGGTEGGYVATFLGDCQQGVVLRLPSEGDNRPLAIAADGTGGLVVGKATSALDVADARGVYAGGEDAFAARYRADATAEWAWIFGADEYDEAAATAALPDGSYLVAGSFHGRMTLGDVTLQSAGGSDAFVVEIDRNGDPQWGRALGGTDDDAAVAVALDPDGLVVVAGSYSGFVASFGTQTLRADPGPKTFVYWFTRP